MKNRIPDMLCMVAALVVAATWSMTVAQAQDMTKMCAGCHGAGAQGAQNTILHGQWAEYLRYAIAQYAAGARQQNPMMKAKLDKLSPADIDALVNYYASHR